MDRAVCAVEPLALNGVSKGVEYPLCDISIVPGLRPQPQSDFVYE